MSRSNGRNELDMIVEYLSNAQNALNLALGQAAILPNKLSAPISERIRRVRQGNFHILKSIKQVSNQAHTSARIRQQHTQPSSGLHNRSTGSSVFQTDSDLVQNSQLAMNPAIQKLFQSYNATVDNPRQRDEFTRLYRPVRVGTANAMKRRRDMNVKPIFQTANSGEYYALTVDGGKSYPVMPCLGLTIQESIYNSGAMGQVFDCPGYNTKLRYRHAKIVKPAFFTPDSAEQQWTLKVKGILDLGNGD